MNDFSNQHEMFCEGEVAPGIEEWRCPRCARRVRLNLVDSSYITLEVGDPFAIHYGSVKNRVPEEKLKVWSRGLEEIDFDKLD